MVLNGGYVIHPMSATSCDTELRNVLVAVAGETFRQNSVICDQVLEEDIRYCGGVCFCRRYRLS